MGFGISIVLMAVGAILVFAVNATISGVSLVAVGWVLMAVGLLGLIASVVRPRASTTYWVIRCKPPPGGVVQPVGRPVKSPVLLVFTSVMVLTTAPVASS